MTRRTTLTSYSGATSRLDPGRGLALDPKLFAWQVKADGAYVQLRTDRVGRIYDVRYRSGAAVPVDVVDGLYGLDVGLDSAVLHGEAMVQTEAGRRDAETFGAVRCFLFDVSRYQGREVGTEPYATRYARLQRWHASVECYTGEQETRDARGNWHGRDGSFVRPTVKNLARVPVLPLARGKGAAEQLWRQHVELQSGEGLVAVRLDAPLGKRGAKVKIKNATELSAVVIAADQRAAVLDWRGHQFVVSAIGKALAPGMVVDVRHDGFYERKVEPRFARITRVREDLGRAA